MLNIPYFRIYLVAILIRPRFFTNAYYYCNKESQLCGTSKHFMCDPNSVPKNGELLGLLPLTRKIKRLYVDRHNELRNKIAGGEQNFKGDGKFPKATRMREVIWDDELAYIAGIHAKRCNMEHDACHATERFPVSGQNLYMWRGGVKPKIKSNELVKSIDIWWSEYKFVEDGNALVDEFCNGADFHKVGHFTAIANERAAFVGCGLALCQNCTNRAYCIEVTCNYSLTNLVGSPMYKTGVSSATECDYYESVPSTNYPNLCENNGKIFDN
ncbi:antigen 5 like allergen Cul n 1 [Zeugodacus cucurbitae]|nr:antigen 5 like allergen Cul n 1 [Zeugodacus cucurbitae]